MVNHKDSIEKTKQGFEESFRLGSYYDKQTKDDLHLNLILKRISVEPGMKILDLGTGSGYLAFPFAKKYDRAKVIGLDIVEKTLEENRRRAEREGVDNLQFVSYDGMIFPFEDEFFDVIITRYALHHFPAIHDTFQEISRVLKPNGIFFLSDPAPNDDDTERFVDEYMQMKKDGHIKFYTKDEWKEISSKVALKYVDGFETKIRFPRKRDASLELEDLISRHKETVIMGYEVEIIEDEVWITEKVNNLTFRKETDMNIWIRATKEEEALELSNIQKSAFQPIYEQYHDEGNPYLRGVEDIANRLSSEYFRYFTIFLDEEIVGGVLYKCKGRTPFNENLEEGQYYLQRVYIKPELQCKGIAQTAILLCEKEFPDAKCFGVDFPEDLVKNRRCYEKVGFVDTGKRLEAQPGLVLACLEKLI